MTVSCPFDEDQLYAELLARNPALDGVVFVAVHTTGIFCRLTCPARKPLRRNVSFYLSGDIAQQHGFRACLRCKPLAATGTLEPLVTQLLAAVAAAPDQRWGEQRAGR